MGLFNNWPAIRRILQLVIIQLFCWLACSVSFCFAPHEISEVVTGSVDFPSVLALTCAGNLALCVTTLIGGKIDLEIGARDALRILLSPELTVIYDQNDGYALTTYGSHMNDVVMFSNGRPNSSVREFMKSSAPKVGSVLLQFLPLRDAGHLVDSVRNVQQCGCGVCNCIVFWTSLEITVMLARRIPGTLKQLSDSFCLLPCLTCLRQECHECKFGMLRTEENNILAKDISILLAHKEPHVVCRILDKSIRTGEPCCICIPLNNSESDKWTELLIRSFGSEDAEASEALEGYLAGRKGRNEGRVEYNIASFIVPSLIETLINIVVTVLFNVDGFSSSLVARKAVRDYIVGSKRSGSAANAFLTKAVVMCEGENTCQLLSFRGNAVGIRTVYFTVGCVNMVCSIVWAVLIAFDGGADTSPPPSKPIVAVILATIAITVAMNYATLWAERIPCFLDSWRRPDRGFWRSPDRGFWRCDRKGIYRFLFFTVIHMEMMCFVLGIIVAATSGTKAFGKWLYCAVQILVFLKWTAGCYLLHEQSRYERTPSTWISLPYSSAFLLNGVLAGVRATWGPWLRKNNYLWSRKLLH